MNIPHITDKYYITYGIFYLLGILTFIPNYFIITASTYWLFKFRYVGIRSPVTDPDIFPGPPTERNTLQASFVATYYIITQLSLIVFIVLTAAYSKKLPPPEKRITAALLCSLVFYIVNLIFVNIVTDTFQIAFFLIVMCIACFLGICGAVIIVSLFEMVSNFPSEYYSAILTAQALCGVISAIIQIITISLSSDSPMLGGFIFFGIGTAMVCVTLSIYTYSKKNSQYFIYHVGNDPMEHTVQPSRRFLVRMWTKAKHPLKNTRIYMISLVIVSGTTAIMYPGVMSLVVAELSDGISDNKWAEFYFVPVVTFLVANLCDLIGRHLATKIKQPNHEWVVLAIAILRIGFIPLLTYCNVQPRFHIPVLFYDVPYVMFTILFMFSNGYLINLCIVTVPTRAQNGEEKSLITVMTVLSGVFSTAMCSFLSLMFVHIV